MKKNRLATHGLRLMRAALLLAACAGTATLQGCASPATTEAMVVAKSTNRSNPMFDHAIKLSGVSGGKETNPLWTSQVGTEEFRQALQQSLINAGYLANNPADAKYDLGATLMQLDQPLMGLTLDVTSDVQYHLVGGSLDKNLPIRVTGTATFSDSPIAIQRLRLANEKSILGNIKELLRQLGEIKP